MISIIYWQHLSGKEPSPKYSSPEPLSGFSDTYFEDYCINDKDAHFCLKTIGIRSCEPDYRLINKFQQRHVMHWVLQGEGWCNGVPFQAGDVIYAKERIPYSFSSNPENPCIYAWITFEGPNLSFHLTRLGIVKRLHIYHTPHTREIYSILYDLLYTPHTDLDVRLHMEAALYQLLSLSAPPQQKEDATEEAENGDQRIHAALRYLSEQYRDPNLRVHMAAEAVGISEKYFRALFKEQMGISVRDYIVKLRMDAAVLLLRTSNYSIGEIAEMTGFTDYRQFSELFKKKLGCSPKQFKNRILSKSRQ